MKYISELQLHICKQDFYPIELCCLLFCHYPDSPVYVLVLAIITSILKDVCVYVLSGDNPEAHPS